MAVLRDDPDLIEALSGFQRQDDALWDTGGQSIFFSQELRGLSPEEHLQRSGELVAAGYRPQAISVASLGSANADNDAGELVAASVWQRPATSDLQAGHWAKRKANAAVTLLILGQRDQIWPFLQHAPDPSIRSF